MLIFSFLNSTEISFYFFPQNRSAGPAIWQEHLWTHRSPHPFTFHRDLTWYNGTLTFQSTIQPKWAPRKERRTREQKREKCSKVSNLEQHIRQILSKLLKYLRYCLSEQNDLKLLKIKTWAWIQKLHAREDTQQNSRTPKIIWLFLIYLAMKLELMIFLG